MFEEGVRIMPARLLREGRRNDDILGVLLGNVRLPEQVLGDIEAQITANEVCARAVVEFLDDTGLPDLADLSKLLQQRSEAQMRRDIEAVPDGVYRATLDADGFDEDRTHIACAVTVKGSEIDIDYAGTSPQIGRAINCVYNYTYAYSVYPIKCLLNPFSARTEGSYRPISVNAPEGCILNPLSCGRRCTTAHRPFAGRRHLQGPGAGDPGEGNRRMRRCADDARRVQWPQAERRPVLADPVCQRRHGRGAAPRRPADHRLVHDHPHLSVAAGPGQRGDRTCRSGPGQPASAPRRRRVLHAIC